MRDGKPYPPANVQQTLIVPDAPSSLRTLKQQGFLLIVVTNQPDIARQKASLTDLQEIHRFLRSELPLDDFFTCFHDDKDQCDCRKPLPGLLLAAAATYNLDLQRSYLIGDRWRDIEAGAAAGCSTILIDYHYNEQRSTRHPDVCVSSLSQAVDWIMKQEMQGN